ncbi:glycosyl hydrolase [Bacteroides sp.]
MKYSKGFWFLLVFIIHVPLLLTAQQNNTLREQFIAPPEDAKPWCFWYWMYGAVSREGITADLEAMKQAGLGGTYLMPIKGVEQGKEFHGSAQQLSPQWWEMVRFSMQEADRLGLKLGMHICDGFALAGGPWITPEESMQKVVWSDTIVAGGKIENLQLPRPESYQHYYQDITLLALPAQSSEVSIPVITASALINTADGFFRANAAEVSRCTPLYPDTAWIQYEYPRPFTCRNVEVVLAGNNYQAHRLKVFASDDGINFRFIRQLIPARQGWQNTDENSTHALPPVTARYFRFSWNPEGSEPGSEDMDAAKWKPNLKIKELRLHDEPRLNQWEGKAGLVWRVASNTTESEVPRKDCVRKQDIIDLTKYMKDGMLTATLPAGEWKLLRMGHTSTGHINPTGGGARGLECDKFSPAAVKKQFDHWFGRTFAEVGDDLAHRVLKYMHVDSWECGSQNWSSSFPDEFRKRRGYDLTGWLPLFAGIPVESAAESEKVLRDVRVTIAELVRDVFYETLAGCAREYDCRFSAECVAPTMVSDGLLHYRKVDFPMGEFWFNSPTHDKPNDMLDAISGAHIYGKNIIQAEGFTQIRGTWNEHPALLKPLLDRNYALGVNRLFFHVYVHNPWLDRRPGMTLDGIGFFFQRDQTWWEKGAKAFVDYTKRCQALLQYGHPVVDIAVFTGEEMPRRSVLPERLVPSLPGLFGAGRVESERDRLANVGQPLRTITGVTHSANMADPERWVNPLRGYAYDSFNKDALLNLASVHDGRLVLPGGASYKVLVLPLPRPMDPDGLPLSEEVRAKVDEWQREGVVIPELPYTSEDFAAYSLERDVIVPEDIAWTHRWGAEADVYFLANQQAEERSFEVSLRGIKEVQPELWNPVTGEMRRVRSWKHEKGRTRMDVTLAAGESVFIVCYSETERMDGRDVPETPVEVKTAPVLLKQPWSVYFSELDKTLERDTLFDWSKESEHAIRHYSGKAIYKNTFYWKGKKGTPVYFRLGKVENIATVKVNGVECGTAWTAPYQVEVTDALRKGVNTLEIEVTNTWANAIRGTDRGEPPFAGIWTNAKYRLDGEELLPAGLFGPLEFMEIKK